MNAICIDRRRDLVRTGLMIAIVLSLIGGARAATPATVDCEARAARAHQVLLADSMENWEPLDDRSVLIWTEHSPRAHLVRLDRAVAGLAAAAVIYLVDADSDGYISPCGRDGVVIGERPGDRQVARIASIELLSARRTADLDPGMHAAFQDSLQL